MIDTDAWKFIPARWFTQVDTSAPRRIRAIVIHDAEFPEKEQAAEGIAQYFATTDTKASAHICVDHESIVQCVHDKDVAWAAPGCNSDGIQIELAGYGAQSSAQWADPYSKAVLNNAANATAQYCLKYTLPIRRLTNDELRAGAKGIVSHKQVSDVFLRSDHQDPGPCFPWEDFMATVQAYYKARALRLGRVE